MGVAQPGSGRTTGEGGAVDGRDDAIEHAEKKVPRTSGKRGSGKRSRWEARRLGKSEAPENLRTLRQALNCYENKTTLPLGVPEELDLCRGSFNLL